MLAAVVRDRKCWDEGKKGSFSLFIPLQYQNESAKNKCKGISRMTGKLDVIYLSQWSSRIKCFALSGMIL